MIITTRKGRQVAERPLHERISDDLRAQMDSGTLRPGDALPSESDLEETYSTSRGTVRKALATLTAEGRISNGQGRPRLVRSDAPLTFHASQSESWEKLEERRVRGVDAWVADVTEQGHEPGQTISVAIEIPPAPIGRLLGLASDEMAVVRRRLRTVDGEPHNACSSWYPQNVAEGTPITHPADVKQGVIALMADLGYRQVRYFDEVTARMPGPDEVRRLRIGGGVPVIVHLRTGYTAERPVRVTETVWPADRARLIFELPA